MSAAMAPAPKILTATSVTKLGDDFRGQVLIAGSHGGVYAGYMAARSGARAVILNDAGGGLDDAGFASLSYLDHVAMAAATVSHDSARIGDGDDMAARGVISHVNATAFALGCHVGQSAMACAELMRQAEPPTRQPPRYEEARFLFSAEGETPAIWGIDSASLVRPDDVGQVVLTASHGGLLGGDPAAAIKYDVLACAFNDAGVGCEGIGITRLPALDGRGIAAVTVDCMTARIGDIRSAWDTGIVSHVNETAAAQDIAAGQTLQHFAHTIRRTGA
jgi:hypothetical protein